MAILKNVVMRGASQRLGGIVLYTRSGETIARELAPSVSNPRTRVQMQQRVKLANVVSMYKANKSWMAGAFEDKAEKETDYNAFVRFNLTDSKVALTKDSAAAGAGVVAPYKVSSGSIAEIEQEGSQTGVRTNLFTGGLIISQSTTIAQLSAALIANNNGIVKGMQLSLIVNIQRQNEVTGRPYIVVRTYEIIINETNTELLTKYIPLGLLETLDLEGGPLFFNGSSLGDGAATFILSQTISGKTRVSTQTLRFYGNQSIYAIYTSAIAVESAIRSYGSNETRFLDSSEASEYNPVVLDNYIQGIAYNSAFYPASAEVPIPITPGSQLSAYFAMAASAGLEGKVYVGGNELGASDVSFNFNAARTRVQVTFNTEISITEATEVVLEFSKEDEIMDFTFYAVPTN